MKSSLRTYTSGLVVAATLLCSCQQAPVLEELATSASELAAQVEAQATAGLEFELPGLETATAVPTPMRDTDLAYSTSDRPDDVDGYQVHFIYALPSDGQDDFLDLDGRIALSANAMNQWLSGQTEGSMLRYDTYQGELDISFMQLDYSAEEINSLGTNVLALMDYEIKSRGFEASNKIFVVYYDGFFVSEQGFCGLANYPPDGHGVTAVLLLRAYIPRFDQPCPRQFTQSQDFTGFFEMTILHEVLHLLGMAPACGQNVQGGHVTDSSQDLMYGEYDGSYSPVFTHLDYGNDDYFWHGDPNCPDLAHSAFLEPLPPEAELPPDWEISSRGRALNPFESLPDEAE